MSHILLVEDQVLFRKALKQLLNEARKEHRVDEVGTAREALQLIENGSYDLLITDLCLKEEDGLWLMCKLNESGLRIPILVVTASERPELLSQAIELGARGCLRKSSEPQQLLFAVNSILEGQTYFIDELPTAQVASPQLNARTLELLCLSNNGIDHEEIRQKMGLSSETFASLAKGACRKLSSETLSLAARKAYTLGLIAGRDHG